ncbi:MAG: M14 family zinc carboxypeptidase [Burkholderiaceae bacterium]|nr:M14 family zinc carboxypeptidase [Burkholderiaceae bacterium]
MRPFADEFPQLVTIATIGTSRGGQPIPLATVPHRATGAAADKPPFWVDGNSHAVELAGATACRHLLDWLTRGDAQDAETRRCLNTRAFYICPRIRPDGAEWALAARPKFVRSVTRRYPYDEHPLAGLLAQDIDGDGRILQMRVPIPNGPWKKHPQEPRLLIRREPTDPPGAGSTTGSCRKAA